MDHDSENAVRLQRSPLAVVGKIGVAPLALGLALIILPAFACGPATPTPQSPSAANRKQPATIDSDELEQLGAIGYIDGTSELSEEVGVLSASPPEMEPGLTIYVPSGGHEAVLVDEQGVVKHRWSASFEQAFPTQGKRSKKPKAISHWRRVELSDDGSLIVLWHLHGFFKLDRNSELIWSRPMNAHHDFQLMPDGSIYAMMLETEKWPDDGDQLYRMDAIEHISPDGKMLKNISLGDAMENVRWRDLRDQFWNREGTRTSHLRPNARQDPFHSNSIHVLTAEEAKKLGAPFTAGQLLVSVLMMDTIVAIDMERVKTSWLQTGPFALQHYARPTVEGHISMFNNFDSPSSSSVQVVDPLSGQVQWEYFGPKEDPLFSTTSSSAEQLPNGNFLIVSANQGRILEVTREKRLVWEYRAPESTSKNKRSNIYFAQRVSPKQLEWLE